MHVRRRECDAARGHCQMEIKHVEEYEKPKFNSFQMKTGRVLMAGAACIALLGMAGALEGCAGMMIEPDHQEDSQQEAQHGNLMADDFSEAALPTAQEPLPDEVSPFINANVGVPPMPDPDIMSMTLGYMTIADYVDR